MKLPWTLLSLLVSTALATDACENGHVQKVVDFSEFVPGEYISQLADGLARLETSGSGYNAQGPRIYDSNNTGGADSDLEVGVGNVLIIQESDQPEPDDNADGGSIKFFFENNVVIVRSITLVDNNVGSFMICKKDGNTVFRTDFAAAGEGQVIETMVRDYEFVDECRLKLKQSGAISQIEFCLAGDDKEESEPTPFPSPEPTSEPTPFPTPEPTSEPSLEPSTFPSSEPTPETTLEPTPFPTPEPTLQASLEPSLFPSPEPTPEPIFCRTFACDEGYVLRQTADTIQGQDRATCCYRPRNCAAVGSPCALGDIEYTLIPNPSFEDFEACPDPTQLKPTSIQGTQATADYLVRPPVCDNAWEKESTVWLQIPQQPSHGFAMVGTIRMDTSVRSSDYHEYIGTCLQEPLQAGRTYTFSVDLAAASGEGRYGGDTNGNTEVLCISTCDLPLPGVEYKGDQYPVLAQVSPGLTGGADWKAVTVAMTPPVDCPAILLGPAQDQQVPAGQLGSYVLYDFLNLQEGAPGVCNAAGECVAVPGN